MVKHPVRFIPTMLKPGTKCAQHRACVTGFRIERITALGVCLYFWIHITAGDHPELGKKAARRSHATISKSVIGICLCEASKLLQGGVERFRRLLVNQKSSSQVPCICLKISRGGPHWPLYFRHVKPE